MKIILRHKYYNNRKELIYWSIEHFNCDLREAIESNHPLLIGYIERFGSKYLCSEGELRIADIPLGAKYERIQDKKDRKEGLYTEYLRYFYKGKEIFSVGRNRFSSNN